MFLIINNEEIPINKRNLQKKSKLFLKLTINSNLSNFLIPEIFCLPNLKEFIQICHDIKTESNLNQCCNLLICSEIWESPIVIEKILKKFNLKNSSLIYLEFIQQIINGKYSKSLCNFLSQALPDLIQKNSFLFLPISIIIEFFFSLNVKFPSNENLSKFILDLLKIHGVDSAPLVKFIKPTSSYTENIIKILKEFKIYEFYLDYQVIKDELSISIEKEIEKKDQLEKKIKSINEIIDLSNLENATILIQKKRTSLDEQFQEILDTFDKMNQDISKIEMNLNGIKSSEILNEFSQIFEENKILHDELDEIRNECNNLKNEINEFNNNITNNENQLNLNDIKNLEKKKKNLIEEYLLKIKTFFDPLKKEITFLNENFEEKNNILNQNIQQLENIKNSLDPNQIDVVEIEKLNQYKNNLKSRLQDLLIVSKSLKENFLENN